MVDVHIVRCKRCKKEIAIDDLAMKPDGKRGNVCNHCADILRSLQVVNVEEVIEQRIDDNKPKYLRCERCRKVKMWPLEFGPRYECKVCIKRNTEVTPAVLKRRRLEQKWRIKNEDKVKETNERYKERKRQWRKEHPVEARKKMAENTKKHRVKVKFAKNITKAKLGLDIAPTVWDGQETGKEPVGRISEMGTEHVQEKAEHSTFVL